MANNTLDELKIIAFSFLFICVEIALGAALFFFIIWIERLLGGFAAIDHKSDPILYYSEWIGKIVLLCADFAGMLFFVGRGVRRAYKMTWGQP